MTRPRLTGHDFQRTVDWIRARWPDSRVWARPVEDLYEDFRHAVTGAALEQAAHDWFGAGHDRAPSPSRLLAAAKQTMRDMSADPRHCLHRIFAVDDLGNGYREATCANPACRHVWTARADQLRTVGERETVR